SSPSLLCTSFSSLLRTPPTSTLFPYTTLFRSERSARAARGPGSGVRIAFGGRELEAHGVADHVARPALDLPMDRSHVAAQDADRSEEHTSELQSPYDLVCRLLLEKKKERMRYQ